MGMCEAVIRTDSRVVTATATNMSAPEAGQLPEPLTPSIPEHCPTTDKVAVQVHLVAVR